MMRSDIYHVEFAKLGLGLSGGETSMLEMIKEIHSAGHTNIILTTDNGQQTYSKLLPNSSQIIYKTIPSHASEKRYGNLISYIFRTFQARKLIKSINLGENDLVICHSEFFPNSISNWLLLRRNTKTKSALFFHMRAPRLFKGYEGEFTNSFHLPTPRNINYLLNQWLYKVLAPKRSVIFTVNKIYLNYLHKIFPHNTIEVLENYGGLKTIAPKTKKKYDLIWLGRFHPQKGIDDIPIILKEVANKFSDLKVLIVGGGDEAIENKLKTDLKDAKITDSVKLAGTVTGNQKLKLISQSKVFIMTSHYESFGLVIIEAMAHGLPVVSYNLPVYDVFSKGIIKVPNSNVAAFANEIINLLGNTHTYENLKVEALEEASNHSWSQCAEHLIKKMGL